jgi:predicted metalloprotease with PDZ domain
MMNLHIRIAVLVVALGALLSFSPNAVAAPARATAIAYEVSLKEPAARTIHVVCDLSRPSEEPVRLMFPSWSPGAYAFRPMSRYIVHLRVDGVGGERATREVATDTYEVAGTRGGGIRVQYDIDLSERNRETDKSFIGDTLALIKGDFTFCYFEGCRDLPIKVKVEAPPGWAMMTTLNKNPTGEGFEVNDYDELIDSSIMMGHFYTASVTSGPADFMVAIDPKLSISGSALVPIVKRLADFEIGLFGSPPFNRYIFFLYAIPESYFNLFPAGVFGIEHRKGSTISFTPQAAATVQGGSLASALERLMAHELFHTWNGKCISPTDLYRPDLNHPIKSPNIWFVEGITRYYEILVRNRTGDRNPRSLYASLAFLLRQGNVEKALEEASMDAWETLSPVLYNKGALVALALDLKIREMTDNRRSLDDVLRLMYQELGRHSKQYTAGMLRSYVSRVTGSDLSDFFDRYVSGSERLDADQMLDWAGLHTVFGTKNSNQDIGIFFNKITNQVVMLLPDGAGQAAGLKQGDKILAVDGRTLESRPFEDAFPSLGAGTSYSLRIARGGQEMDIRMVINPIEIKEVTIVENEKPNPKQVRIREGFLSRTTANAASS